MVEWDASYNWFQLKHQYHKYQITMTERQTCLSPLNAKLIELMKILQILDTSMRSKVNKHQREVLGSSLVKRFCFLFLVFGELFLRDFSCSTSLPSSLGEHVGAVRGQELAICLEACQAVALWVAVGSFQGVHSESFKILFPDLKRHKICAWFTTEKVKPTAECSLSLPQKSSRKKKVQIIALLRLDWSPRVCRGKGNMSPPSEREGKAVEPEWDCLRSCPTGPPAGGRSPQMGEAAGGVLGVGELGAHHQGTKGWEVSLGNSICLNPNRKPPRHLMGEMETVGPIR